MGSPLTVKSVDGEGVSAIKRDEPLQRIRVVRVEVGESRHHDEVDHLVLLSRMRRADLAVARFVLERRARATAARQLLGASDILRRNVARRSARQRAARRVARLKTRRTGLEARVLVLRILAGFARTRARARVGAARGASTGFHVVEARTAAFVPTNLHLLVCVLDARKNCAADCGATVRVRVGSAIQKRDVAC